jgi:hypothetical protein
MEQLEVEVPAEAAAGHPLPDLLDRLKMGVMVGRGLFQHFLEHQ